MSNHKPDNFAALFFGNQGNRVLCRRETPHGLPIEPKLLRKANLIQMEQILKIRLAIVPKHKIISTH
jgi:hypothetical protein